MSDLETRVVMLEALLAESEAECAEQARLNGMGSEREARLMAKLAAAEAETAREREARKHDALKLTEVAKAAEAEAQAALDMQRDALEVMTGMCNAAEAEAKRLRTALETVRPLLRDVASARGWTRPSMDESHATGCGCCVHVLLDVVDGHCSPTSEPALEPHSCAGSDCWCRYRLVDASTPSTVEGVGATALLDGLARTAARVSVGRPLCRALEDIGAPIGSVECRAPMPCAKHSEPTPESGGECRKCAGTRWLWGHELDNASDETAADTMTRYPCDACPGPAPDSGRSGRC